VGHGIGRYDESWSTRSGLSNFVRGFPAVQGNFAVQSVRRPERLNMQIKAETFNVFNHPNFGYIDPSLSDLLFGQSTKMPDQSFGNSGALYNEVARGGFNFHSSWCFRFGKPERSAERRFHISGYSYLRESIGLTFEARRAGTKLAKRTTEARRIDTLASVATSNGLTP
jgi:hypothetical protein